MKQGNIDYLEANKGIYDTLVNAGFIANLTSETRENLLRITREEFSPGYLCCLHCTADVAALVKYVYTQYNVFKQSQPKEQPKAEPKKKNEKPRKNLP